MKMPAYKNKETGTWYVMTQYTDWTGERKQKCKRGFSTRREALEWEQKFQQQSSRDLDMNFEAFIEIYTADLKVRLKPMGSYEYNSIGQCGDKWIGNFCPAPSNDSSCHRTRACCYYRCEGAAIPKKLLHDPS